MNKTKLQCLECEEYNDRDEWSDVEVACEDCGTHPALRCPSCGEYLDLVYLDEDT